MREGVILAALAIAAVYLGVHPGPVLDAVKEPIGLLTGVK
jgi:NADH-quinone oxidoreductase subunit M